MVHTKKKIAVLALAIGMSLSQVVWAAPAAPTGLTAPVQAVSATSLSLIWDRPARGDDAVSYNIYMDGKLVGKTAQDVSSTAKQEIRDFYKKSPKAQRVICHNYRLTNLQAGSTHTFTVRAVDASGEESTDSNSIIGMMRKNSERLDVTKYGAVGDCTTLNTAAIQKAIDACPAGGTVVIPAGIFKTGSLWLKSDMTLEVQKNGTILGTEDPSCYPYRSDDRYYSLINARPGEDGKRLKNIRIVGEGCIDGNGWKKDENGNYFYRKRAKKGEPLPANHVSKIGILAANQVAALEKNKGLDENQAYPRRSSLILLQGVDHAYISGITMKNPANHTLILQKCNDAVVEEANFQTFYCNNGDGIEFIHGKGLKVYNNVFNNGDDCVNFSAGKGAEGAKSSPTENIWIFNNSFHNGHGAVVMGSHTAAYIQKLLAEDNVIDGTEIALRMKTNPANGGGGRDVLFRNNAARNLKKNFFIATTAYNDPNANKDFPKAAKAGCFYNIRLEDCTVEKTGKAAIEIVGLPEAKHHDIVFKNITIDHGQPWIIINAENIVFENVQQSHISINEF
ncbi:glycoside hydrolase family 28 protein [Selenomonas ruminantium]|uniref:Exo-poly-alpha-galacturonosidase n=1 Tax=Selenomonas ruminantium TaxID=971 RepID=A0A1I0WZI2_SELRU|nr:glycoside hydrolase family 28 protein [Selenomonas ruminantium]SFA93994.1 exo-poly-alpha-galacturonosidase [Selenomonas ruminantium]